MRRASKGLLAARRTERRDRLIASVLLLALLAGWALNFISVKQLSLGLGSFLASYLIIGLSLLILAGWAGQISLGQFAFVGVGSAAAAWMTLHWQVDLILQLVLAGLLGAAVAVVIGIPALRIRGLFLAVATLAFTFAASSYFLSTEHFHWLPDQFTPVPRLPLLGRIYVDSADRYYYFSYAVLLCCIFAEITQPVFLSTCIKTMPCPVGCRPCASTG